MLYQGYGKENSRTACARCWYISDGYNQRKYKYPDIDLPFKHPMVNWENLLFCGGFALRDSKGELVTSFLNLAKRVAEGKKPIGFLPVKEDKVPEYIELAEKNNLRYRVKEHWWEGYKELCLAQKGKVGEIINLEEVRSSYIDLENHTPFILFGQVEWDQLFELENHELSDFLDGWDYANPETLFEYTKTGLLLGYAIESTFAIVTEYLFRHYKDQDFKI